MAGEIQTSIQCRLQCVNAVDYGVPQHRWRVFVIGVRSDLSSSPSPQHTGKTCSTTCGSRQSTGTDMKFQSHCPTRFQNTWSRSNGYCFLTRHITIALKQPVVHNKVARLSCYEPLEELDEMVQFRESVEGQNVLEEAEFSTGVRLRSRSRSPIDDAPSSTTMNERLWVMGWCSCHVKSTKAKWENGDRPIHRRQFTNCQSRVTSASHSWRSESSKVISCPSLIRSKSAGCIQTSNRRIT